MEIAIRLSTFASRGPQSAPMSSLVAACRDEFWPECPTLAHFRPAAEDIKYLPDMDAHAVGKRGERVFPRTRTRDSVIKADWIGTLTLPATGEILMARDYRAR